MRKLLIHIEQPEQIGDVVRRACVIERTGCAKNERNRLYFDIPSAIPAIADDDGEPFLTALVMAAMAEKRDVMVSGRVSATLLANLEEYCAAWNCWLPREFTKVSIDAAVVEQYSPVPAELFGAAIAPFSGGADSSFTVWQHVSDRTSHRSLSIKCCAMVRGFDIPYANTGEYWRAFHKAAETLTSVGIRLVPIATNFRDISRLNWGYVFAAAMMACLHFLKRIGHKALIPSGEPYNYLLYPWGSTPMTDHLLSSDSLQAVHDGAAFSRTEKVAAIARWPDACNNLRVCWEGASKDRNCGVCEKCVRTHLNFRANGLKVPDSLGAPVKNSSIRRVRLANETIRTEFRQIYDVVKKNNINDGWVWSLRYLLLCGPLRSAVRARIARILKPLLLRYRRK